MAHTTLFRSAKLRRLCHKLGISRPTAIGHLECLWMNVADQAPDGDISRFDAMDVAIFAEWEGDPGVFLDTMIGVGFLDRVEANICGEPVILRVHDWFDWAQDYVFKRLARRYSRKRPKFPRWYPAPVVQRLKRIIMADLGLRERRAAAEQRTKATGAEASRSEGNRIAKPPPLAIVKPEAGPPEPAAAEPFVKLCDEIGRIRKREGLTPWPADDTHRETLRRAVHHALHSGSLATLQKKLLDVATRADGPGLFHHVLHQEGYA